jgi:hypothetical protein
MRACLFLVLLCPFLTAQAQIVNDEPCPAPVQERSIHFCLPGDGSVVTPPFTVRAKVTDSRPVQVQFCINSCPEEWGAANWGKDIKSVGTGTFGPRGWQRLIVRARDDLGEFQRAIWANINNSDPPCTAGTQDNSITICAPTENETVTSPVRVAAVATDNNFMEIMLLYVNGVKQDQVASRKSKFLGSWILLPQGRHRVTVWARNSQRETYKKTVNINVAPTPRL